MASHARSRPYKEMRLQQLRSFCETARLGSLAAAAKSLGLAQPTVWKQVHALESEFSARLLEPHARGCRLTDEGRLLVSLAAPSIAGVDELRRCFEECRERMEVWLTVAASQRTFSDDLAQPFAAFLCQHPYARLRLHDVSNTAVASLVESCEADVGLLVRVANTFGSQSAWLEIEPAYELDVLLVTTKDHPLSRRRVVRPRDLVGYPLVNSRESLGDPAVVANIEKHGLFRANSCRVVAKQSAIIRHYVELGYGIGLVAGTLSRPQSAKLHERSMGRYFGRTTISFVWRRGSQRQGLVHRLMDTIKKSTKRP